MSYGVFSYVIGHTHLGPFSASDGSYPVIIKGREHLEELWERILFISEKLNTEPLTYCTFP